jgi:hypothetical protein
MFNILWNIILKTEIKVEAQKSNLTFSHWSTHTRAVKGKVEVAKVHSFVHQAFECR